MTPYAFNETSEFLKRADELRIRALIIQKTSDKVHVAEYNSTSLEFVALTDSAIQPEKGWHRATIKHTWKIYCDRVTGVLPVYVGFALVYLAIIIGWMILKKKHGI